MSAHLSSVPHVHHPYLFAAVVIAALLPGRAAAQPVDDLTGEPSTEATASVTWDLAPIDAEARSPPVATALSASVTLAAAMMVVVGISDDDDELATAGVAGIAVGPSVGHWYGGRLWNRGTGLRLGGVIIGSAGLALVAGCLDGRNLPCDLGGDALISGAVAYVAGTVYEIVTAPRTAREQRQRGWRGGTRLVVTTIEANDRIVPGVAMVARF